MKRVLTRIGIGSATVDTILPRTELSPGETVEATVELDGGDSDQEIERIYFSVVTAVDGEDVVLDTFDIPDGFTLAAGETRSLETELTLPMWTPLTRDSQRVWLETGLDVEWAVDPSDRDDIEVLPGEFLEALFDAVDALGFRFVRAEIGETPWLDRQPFAQEFEFEPREGPFRDDLDGLAVVAVPRETDLRTFVEIDEDEPAEHMTDQDFDEQEVSITFDAANADMMRRRLKSVIDRHTHT